MSSAAAQRRYRIYRVPEYTVLGWFAMATQYTPDYILLPHTVALPADAVVVGTHLDWARQLICFKVASWEFDAVEDGEEADTVDLFDWRCRSVALANPDDYQPVIVEEQQ